MPNPLLDAIKSDDYARVVSILNQKRAINSAILNQEYHYSDGIVEQEVSAIPLHLATFLLNPQLVKLMLKRGADPNIKCMHHDYTPLDWVTSNGNLLDPGVISRKLEIIDLLFYYGAQTNVEITKRCIAVSVELGYYKQMQPFHYNNQIIMSLQYHKILNRFLYLVRQGAFQEVLNVLDKIHCVQHPYVDYPLCKFKINPNCDGGIYGTAILYAAELESPTMLNLLFSREVDLTVVDLMGNNVFHYAARAGRIENITWLYQHLPKDVRNRLINAGNKDNNSTPLHFAAKYNHVYTVEKLLSLGSKRENKNSQNKTAEALNITEEVKVIFEMYPDGPIPTLVWLAAKASAKNNLSFSNTSYLPEMDELINLSKTGTLSDDNITNTSHKRKRGNSV